MPGAEREAREGGRRLDPRLAGAALLALVALVYFPLLGHELLNYDDPIYLTDNPHLRLGLSRAGVAWAFTTFYGANWFPLTWLSWLAEYQLHGLSPRGLLATNLLLHSGAALGLFAALRRLTGATGRSLFVAAVFALHPLHVESVAWASARKDVLSGFFWMLTLWAYAVYAERPRSLLRYLAVAGALSASLLAKAVGVTLPFVLLLLDFWPLARIGPAGGARVPRVSLRRAVAEKLPLLALSAVAAVLTFFAQRSAGMTISTERLPLADRVGNALVAYLTYLIKTLWPSGLAVFYPHPGHVPLAIAAAAGGALAAVTVGAWALARRSPALLVGWLWFLGTLVPMIGLVQVGVQARADRYTYLPLVGLALALAWAVEPARLGRRAARGLAAAAAIAVLALGAAARLQLGHWRNSVALFEHALAAGHDSSVVRAHLGAAYLAEGREADAAREYRHALELFPNHLEVLNNLAWLLATSDDPALRRPHEAIRLAKRAATLTGWNDPAVLDTLATAYGAAGRPRAAQRLAARALSLALAQGKSDLARRIEARLETWAGAGAAGSGAAGSEQAARRRPSGVRKR